MRKLAGSAMLFVFGSFTALLLAELAVRVVMPQQLIFLNDRVWMPDSLLGWKHVPNANERVNLGEKTVTFVSDGFGHRQNKQASLTSNSDYSVLFLGDSFLEALQVENEDTFPEIIKRTFRERYGRELAVLNTGVGGWSPNQYYLAAREELSRRQFDLAIVCLYVGNDFVSRFDTLLIPRTPVERHSLRAPVSWSLSAWKTAVFYPINDFLETRSHLFILLRNRSQTFLSKVGLTAEYFPPIFQRTYEQAVVWPTTALICTRIEALCRHYGTRVLFVLLPTPYQVHQEVFKDFVRGFNIDESSVDLEQPNRRITAELLGYGIKVLDPLAFLRARASEGESLYGKVDNHFNESGHRAIAEFLLPFIEKLSAQSAQTVAELP